MPVRSWPLALLIALCLPLLSCLAAASEPLHYAGTFSCGDTATYVSFSYDTATRTIDDFEVHDLCSTRLSQKLVSLQTEEPRGVKVARKWSALEPFTSDRRGNIKYRDEMGYQIFGQFCGRKPKGTKAPGKKASGFLGRPTAKLIECDKGQYFLPCSKWQAIIKD